MDYEKRYKEETGKIAYMVLIGTACLTVEYGEWLKKECGKKDKKLKAIEGLIKEYNNKKLTIPMLFGEIINITGSK